MSECMTRQRKMLCTFLMGLSVILLLGPQASEAQAPVCRVRITPVRFGDYDPGSNVPTDSVGNVRIRCRRQGQGQGQRRVAYTISLSAGRSGTYLPRHMVRRQRVLIYNLYTDTTHSEIWGDGSGSTSVVRDRYRLRNSRVTRNYPIYGRMPALQDVRPGRYRDTIVVTVEF